MDTTPLHQLRRTWRDSAPPAMAQALAAALGDHFGLEGVPRDPLELFSKSGPLSELQRHEGLSLLLKWADHSRLARVLLIAALAPGLTTVFKELDGGRGGPWHDCIEFEADVVSTAFEIVVAWSGQSRTYVARAVLAATRLRLHRRIIAERRRQMMLASDRCLDSFEAAPPMSTSDVLMSWASNMGAPSHVDARLAVLRLAHGYTWRELAHGMGGTRRQLELRVKHGARQLLEVAAVMSTPTRTGSVTPGR